MAQRKKLQVFISSTFLDLKEERQAAVEAVLTAGHIPAGMELFTAGDESQMHVINRWIDESDIYLLILGGRYGTVEPVSQKSYIHLEYDYAVSQQKPLFALVIDDQHLEHRLKQHGFDVIERDHQQQLQEFRSYVLTRIVKFWSDPRDIKLAIMETMAEFERRPNLIGWIPGNEGINGGAVVEEIARLTKENSDLRMQLSRVSTTSPATYNGLTFEQMRKLVTDVPLDISSASGELLRSLQPISEAFQDSRINMLHFLWAISGVFQRWTSISRLDGSFQNCVHRLSELGLMEETQDSGAMMTRTYYALSSSAQQFLLRLRVESDMSTADKYILRSLDQFQTQK